MIITIKFFMIKYKSKIKIDSAEESKYFSKKYIMLIFTRTSTTQ